jgi:uncharacterized protein (DUF2147 family)
MRKLALVALSLSLLALPAQAAVPIAGKWLTDNGDSIMEIGPCGPAMCGKVHKVLKAPPGGGVALDKNNPDPALRNRPILGLTLFRNFKDGGNEWTGGTLYDPRAGKEYKGTLVRLANGNLKLTGCWGPFCRSKVFTPVR